ncbi:MAG TPA: thioredoxin domain-containing protein [Blastocatellia bacterium]|nr:thioredoxin domain-containing protein [Blastocatellia bacterium]
MNQIIRSLIGAAVVSVVCLSPGLAQKRDDKPQSKEAALQQQIDELKAGQQQILKELQEIKKILQSFQEAAAPPPQEIIMPVGGEPFKGNPTARVAVIEYSDYQCPFCGEYAREVFPRLEGEYIKSGKARYYFRDLPLQMHPQAMAAAMASRCAGDQGKFWEMHERLFANQNALGPDALKQHAAALGLDAARFDECMATDKYRNPVRRSIASAERLRIDGTPAFLIGVIDSGGQVVRVSQVLLGAQTYDEFKAALDKMLAAPGKQ